MRPCFHAWHEERSTPQTKLIIPRFRSEKFNHLTQRGGTVDIEDTTTQPRPFRSNDPAESPVFGLIRLAGLTRRDCNAGPRDQRQAARQLMDIRCLQLLNKFKQPFTAHTRFVWQQADNPGRR